jgi:uncharacterized membrane protein YebE (DUF533 family)
MIEHQAHVAGLTERMKTFLEQNTGARLDLAEITREAEAEAAAQEQQNRFSRPPREESFRRNDDDQ